MPTSTTPTHLPSFVLGFADGLTVPFALTVGFATLGSQKLVILGGLAELFSGAISMGLGQYLAALTDVDSWERERRRLVRGREGGRGRGSDKVEGEGMGGEDEETMLLWEDREKGELLEILGRYGVGRGAKVRGFVDELWEDREGWVQFMMDLELKMERPEKGHAVSSAIVMGAAYMLGGLLPMIPYFLMSDVYEALYISIGLAIVVLIVFGFLKCWLFGGTTAQSLRSAGSTLVIGVVAASASYAIVRAIDSSSEFMHSGGL